MRKENDSFKIRKESVVTVDIVVVSLRYSAAVVEVVSGSIFRSFFLRFLVMDKTPTVLRFH